METVTHFVDFYQVIFSIAIVHQKAWEILDACRSMECPIIRLFRTMVEKCGNGYLGVLFSRRKRGMREVAAPGRTPLRAKSALHGTRSQKPSVLRMPNATIAKETVSTFPNRMLVSLSLFLIPHADKRSVELSCLNLSR